MIKGLVQKTQYHLNPILSSLWRQPFPRYFNSHLYGSALRKCVCNNDVPTALAIHCHVIKQGDCLDLFAQNILLHFYSLHSLTSASLLFDQLPHPNNVSYVTLLHAFLRRSLFSPAIRLISSMLATNTPNEFVFSLFIKLLVKSQMPHLCSAVHARVHKAGFCANPFVGASLIDCYTLNGAVHDGRAAFDEIANKDMICWSGIITCYAENQRFYDALAMFSLMRNRDFVPNHYTYVSVLRSCVGLNMLRLGEAVHGLVLKTRHLSQLYVAVGLLDLYSRFDRMNLAELIFEKAPKNDVVPWSFMVSRYAQLGESEKALAFFVNMKGSSVCPNNFTYASALQACAELRFLRTGQGLHCHVVKGGCVANVFVKNSLIDLYAKCGMMRTSVELFESVEDRTDVTWNTMIVGFVQNDYHLEALLMLKSMFEGRFAPSEVTYSSSLSACASLAAMETGTQLHGHSIKTTYNHHNFVANSLIDMYSKCGSISKARAVFERIASRDEVSWNAMIMGYASHGLGIQALQVFDEMKRSGPSPSHQTFIGVLSACANSNLFEEGKKRFEEMVRVFRIDPIVEHYTCMVSLYGRAGDLKSAMDMITNIRFPPSVMMWRALLGACAIHKNCELARVSAMRILELEPGDNSARVLLSNVYASSNKWRNVAEVRKEMKEAGVRKDPGLSWVEIRGEVHYFMVGGASDHPDARVIRGLLEWLKERARRSGYVPDCSVVLAKVEDDEKMKRVWGHSERWALALGLFRSPRGCDIRIIKNLRICGDCHAFMKVISKILSRRIVVRDMNRYHCMDDGSCSCADYW